MTVTPFTMATTLCMVKLHDVWWVDTCLWQMTFITHVLGIKCMAQMWIIVFWCFLNSEFVNPYDSQHINVFGLMNHNWQNKVYVFIFQKFNSIVTLVQRVLLWIPFTTIYFQLRYLTHGAVCWQAQVLVLIKMTEVYSSTMLYYTPNPTF